MYDALQHLERVVVWLTSGFFNWFWNLCFGTFTVLIFALSNSDFIKFRGHSNACMPRLCTHRYPENSYHKKHYFRCSVRTDKPPSTTFKHVLVTGVNMGQLPRSSVPVVLFDLIPSPRTWINCCTDSVFCWRRRRSENRARPFPEYLQSGRVISGCYCGCIQGPTTPTSQVWWNPRRARTDDRCS